MMRYFLIFLSITFSLAAHYLFCFDIWREGLPRRMKLLFFSVRYGILSWLLHFLALCCWIFVLASFDLSYAFPLLSLGYILIVVYNVYKLKLHLSFVTFLGIVCILAGVFLIIKF